ncbi:MAG: hypothetical protein SNJ54_01860 [Anaerolineae bacterium]
MSIEGLTVLLEKKEVVPTYTARDLMERPHQVDADYLYHVRTYVPINRAGVARETDISVEEFERRLIKQVKEGRVPRGYITAGFGYGKTTTALYLWDRGQKANLVVVPPFTLTDLIDFLHAIYGWLRYKLEERAPTLIAKLEQLYYRYIDISLDQLATSYNLTAEQARSLLAEGRLVLELRANDYMQFLEEATRLTLEAGYEGLVILPDEIQQYIRPRVKGSGDPITPFFSIIQMLTTRATGAELPFGFVMVITREELSLIRDNYRRGDLLHRMKDLQIDLTSLYDEEFAPNLWHLMAKQFGFEAEKNRVVAPETLRALGEISARSDLSDGPRTIVNVFARMVRRHVEAPHLPPYTPIDLMTDFLDEQVISFAGDDKLRKVLRRALESPFVRENPARYADAVKLAAAFPTKGVTLEIQKRYRLDQPLSELMRRAIGDLVQAGLIDEGAVRLSGLAQVREQTSWLPSIIREFRLGFSERADITRERFETAFIKLLREKVFSANRWKLEAERERNYVANRSLTFRGTFESIRSKYPSRRVQVRLLWGDEPVKDTGIDGDICIEYQFVLPEPPYRQEPGRLAESSAYTARFELNLYYHQLSYIPQNVQQWLQDVWSPYELSPVVLGAIYALIEEKRAEGVIPKSDESVITRGFQPGLMDAMHKLLFNPNIYQYRSTEEVVGLLLEARYPDYDPLITVDNWQSSIMKYINALGKLESFAQRIGELEVENTKEKIAELFTLTNTGLDSFMRSFEGILIEQVREYARGGGAGSVRFMLHPMEQTLMQWLRQSEHTSQQQGRSRTYTIHQLNLAKAWREAANLGYLKEEFDKLLELLQARGLAEVKGDWLVEVVAETFDLDELRQHFRRLERDLKTLEDTFGSSSLLQNYITQFEKLRPTLKTLNEQGNPDDKLVTRFSMALQKMRKDIEAWVEDQRKTLSNSLQGTRVALLPSAYLAALQKPLPVEVEYADQVNVLRTALLQELERSQNHLKARQTQIDEIDQHLQESTTNYEELAAQASKLEQLKRSKPEAERERQRAEGMHQDYGRWQALVNNGQQFMALVKNKTGADYDDLRTLFNDLSIDIRGEISSQQRKLNALNAYLQYEERMEALLQKVRSLQATQRDQFNHFQDKMKQLLNSYQLTLANWRDVRFHESDGDSSYAEVARNVRRIIGEQQTVQIRKVEDARQRLSTSQSRLHDLTPSQRDTLQAEAQQLLAESEALVGGLKSVSEQIAHALGLYDVSAVETALRKWASLRDSAHQWLKAAHHVDQQLQTVELTPLEKELMNSIQSMPDPDFVALREAFSNKEVFWQALRGLYEKARVKLQVRLIDNSG